jgi:hypothetical protein
MRVCNILTIGQSNIASYMYSTKTDCTPPEDVQFLDTNGKFYHASCTPEKSRRLATGVQANYLYLLGQKIIKSNMYDTVRFVNIGVGGTKLEWWLKSFNGERENRTDDNFVYKSVNKRLWERVLFAIKIMKEQDFHYNYILWHQGESDAYFKTSKADYYWQMKEFINSIRKIGINAPFYLSVATRLWGGVINSGIQDAQKQVVCDTDNCYLGVVTDILDSNYRGDDLHFNDKGMEAVSDMWLDVLRFRYKVEDYY